MEDEKWKIKLINEAFKNEEKAIETLKQQYEKNSIKKFYKYREGNEQDITNLYNDVLYASIGSKFNDPFEFHATIATKESFEKFFTEKLGKKLYEETIDILSEKNVINKNCSIDKLIEELSSKKVSEKDDFYSLCLSSRKDSILMWSHYSKNHEGFCIEYDSRQLAKKIALPVIYEEIPENLFNQDNISLLFRKYKDWKYENEWRIIEKRKGRADESIPINMPKPPAIYLGCKVDSKLKCELLLYCREKNVQCYEAKINNKSYELNFKKIIL